MTVLSPAERSALRARAHKLRPVVLIGDSGLSEQVLFEIDRNLTAHELIKIRVAGAERKSRDSMLELVCEKLDATPVQHIGRMLVVFRPRPEDGEQKSRRPRRRVKPRHQTKRSFQNR